MSISDRIASVIKEKGMSIRAFEQQIGCSNGVISRCISRKTDIQTQWVSKIIEIHEDVNPEWLLTGKGTMLKDDNIINHSERTGQTHLASEKIQSIPLIPLNAMAGAFTGDTTVLEYECERYIIPDFQGADFLIRIKGDSMQPTYYAGDLVACQRVPLNDLFFQWNKTYILDTVQGPLIKRIKRGSDDNHILIVSDNTKYEPFELSKDQFHGVALVRGIVRLE